MHSVERRLSRAATDPAQRYRICGNFVIDARVKFVRSFESFDISKGEHCEAFGVKLPFSRDILGQKLQTLADRQREDIERSVRDT